MEKVRLTREQADAIEKIKDKDYAINLLTAGKRPDSPLMQLSTAELAKAFYIGYEVEQEVKVGDFVDIGLFGISKVAEVTGVNGKLIAINGSDEYHKFKINRVLTDEEKQEEKQRRWWKKHGRKVWELKENDSILNQSEHDWYPDIIKSTNEFNVELSDGEYIPWHLVKRNYKVFCFAEDRKDVVHAE